MRYSSDIKELINQHPTKAILSQLQSICQHYVRNAFYDLDFGENPGGIHTASPIEMLHGLGLVLVPSSRPWQLVMVHFTPKNKEQIKQFLDLFQTLLALHLFTKTKKLHRDMFRIHRGETESRASNAIRICVQKFKSVLKWKKGNGTKLTKVHQMLHVAFYIDMFGSAINWYGSPCESLHKYFVKSTGQKTQRRPDNFEQ
eukprot:scaffold51711_cov66-Attheya_sp.AAC.2